MNRIIASIIEESYHYPSPEAIRELMPQETGVVAIVVNSKFVVCSGECSRLKFSREKDNLEKRLQGINALIVRSPITEAMIITNE